MGEVIEAPFITRLDGPPDRVLNHASAADLEGVVVVGWHKDGEFYFHSSIANGGDNLWLFELAKKSLLEVA